MFRPCAERHTPRGRELASSPGMNICVHTSSSFWGEAEPHVFFVGSRRLIVCGIIQRWADHPHRYYEVACEDGRSFLLRYDTVQECWELAGVFARRVRAKPAAAKAAEPLFQPRRWWSALRRA
jgi:hypothetical protein